MVHRLASSIVCRCGKRHEVQRRSGGRGAMPRRSAMIGVVASPGACDEGRTTMQARRCLLIAAALWPAWPLRAQPAASPSFSLKLVRPTNSGPTTHDYDPASLAAVGTSQLATHVPWDAKPHVWEGVRLKRLLASQQIVGRSLRVKALNDYVALIPWSDLEQFDPLLAWLRDGQPIPVREKGALLVIYPFAAHSELKRAEYTYRSVWHVNEIVDE
jgi:hypothetical protein